MNLKTLNKKKKLSKKLEREDRSPTLGLAVNSSAVIMES